MKASKILKRIEEAVSERERSSLPRTYLGMSGSGDPCPRKIWLIWRWGKREIFSSRILRLFNRGNREEEVFIELLRSANFKVDEIDSVTGKQFAYSDQKGHVKGHCDGEVTIKKKIGIIEMKTHNNKSFLALKRAQSVKVSKHVHFCQMQRYMEASGRKFALYMAVNKDDDDLYLEIVTRDDETISWLLERESDLVWRKGPPARITENPDYWYCRFCHFQNYCFFNQPLDENCRTCSYSRTRSKGKWQCLKRKTNLSLNEQLEGCRRHRSL